MADLDDDTIRGLKFISASVIVTSAEITAKCKCGPTAPYISALARRGYVVARGEKNSYYVATPEGDALLDKLAKAKRAEKKGVPSCDLF